jgi:homoserine dehydrogenase
VSSDVGLQHARFDVTRASRALLNRTVHLDVRAIRVGLLGYGRIGQAVAQLTSLERERLRYAGVDMRCSRAFVRDVHKIRGGLPLPLTTDAAHVIGSDVDVVVEALGCVEPARTLVAAALRAGVPVVTANKTLMATHGVELRALAERHQTALAFDAAVLAGVPFLGSLSRRPLIAAPSRIEGVMNGTSHFLLGEIERGALFDDALIEAVSRGYAEPDSLADTSGRDAAEKLTILLHLAGCCTVRAADLPCTGLEVVESSDFDGARRLGGTLKPVALAWLDPGATGAWVGPAFVAANHPFARLGGVTNAVQLTGRAGQQVSFSGPGAGPEATAATIVDDIVEVVTGGFANAPLPSGPASGRVPAAALREAPPGPWFVRVSEAAALPVSQVAEFLAARGVPALHLISHDRRVYALTTPASWPAIRSVLSAFEASGGRALALPVLNEGEVIRSSPGRRAAAVEPISAAAVLRPAVAPLTVCKIGGSVLTGIGVYQQAAAFLRQRAVGGDARLLAVVSAEAGHTDALLREAQAVADVIGRDALDLLWSTGELRSVALLTLALRAAGVPAVGLNVHETGLCANADRHGREWRIDLRPVALRAAIADHPVVVVPGFLATREAQIITLGRGGSDWSAVLLAASLGATQCDLIKDVDGYFTADPHASGASRPIARLDYDEALRMADEGCPLVQRQAIAAAQTAHLPLIVRSFTSVGTIVGSPEPAASATNR